MPDAAGTAHTLTQPVARRMWLRAQRLESRAPFGDGPEATRAAVEHLGYVQIDTIHVIERSHHHILYTRIPDYRREHLHRAQAVDKSVFEYWTHALSYVSTTDIRFFLGTMRRYQRVPHTWLGAVSKNELRRVLALIRKNGPLTIRDIADEVLVEKSHPWASRKPSKRVLQVAFFAGLVTISERAGMLKTYELIERHFGWDERPAAASEPQLLSYSLERALRSQGLVSVDSVCHADRRRRPGIRRLIAARVRRKELVPVVIDGLTGPDHWARPDVLDAPTAGSEMVHVLSPFDPLVIQRKRLQLFFGYEHRFEAYLPKEKRQWGYFALPVLMDDAIVAAIDLKTDRVRQKLLIQQWTWVGVGSARRHKRRIEEKLHHFERFQLAS